MKTLSQATFLQRASANAKRAVDLSRFIYSGSTNKGIAICPNHGEFQISANALMRGEGCHKCAVAERSARQVLTLSTFIAKAKKVHGDTYDYSKVIYIDSRSKVTIVCNLHGEFYQVANSHLSGRGCPTCANLKIGFNSRLPQAEFINQVKAKHGDRYDLSGIVYTGRAHKIKVTCRTHGVFYPQAGNFAYLGSGCPECGKERVGAKARRTLESFITDAKKVHGDRFTYGELKYIGGTTYLTVICKDHGEFTQVAQDHLRGIGCVKCSKPMFDTKTFVSSAISVHGDRYDYSVSNYTDSLSKVEIICPSHGPFMQAPNYHVNDSQGCPRCARNGVSTGHMEILEFVNKHLYAVQEYPFDGSRRRLDIFIPSAMLAVEFHGLIWHSTAFSLDPLKDYKKHMAAEAVGIRVMHIYQDEWDRGRDIVERTLLSAIGFLPKIYARNTSVSIVESRVAAEFLELNHLQGSCQSSCSIGLFQASTMVACMSFGMARSIRTNIDKGLWELQRYASTCTVVGGASRLLYHFINLNLCHTLVSYSDSRLFSGNMYAKLGFTLEHQTDPDYCYVNNNNNVGRVHKAKFQRKYLPNRLSSFDPSKTEVQNCYDNGWYQLFDCGKKKWTLICK